MRQLATLASSQIPWLLPAVGLALFVRKHFLAPYGRSSADARIKAGARSRPPKLRRHAAKALAVDAALNVQLVLAKQEQLADAVLGQDRILEWFTEDEVEALQQAHANPEAFAGLLQQFGSPGMADAYEDDTEDWYTDGGYDNHADLENNGAFKIRPLELLQGPYGSNMLDPSGVDDYHNELDAAVDEYLDEAMQESLDKMYGNVGHSSNDTQQQQRQQAWQQRQQRRLQQQDGGSQEEDFTEEQEHWQWAQQALQRALQARQQQHPQQQHLQDPLQEPPDGRQSPNLAGVAVTAGLVSIGSDTEDGNLAADFNQAMPITYHQSSTKFEQASSLGFDPEVGGYLQPQSRGMQQITYMPEIDAKFEGEYEPDYEPDIEPDMGFDYSPELSFDLGFDAHGLGGYGASDDQQIAVQLADALGPVLEAYRSQGKGATAAAAAMEYSRAAAAHYQ